MKVCTDACILGAWFAEKIPSYSTVLDIGSGTGLLMLMLAQKNKSEIDGIEVDLNAYKQQKENIEQSPWKDQLRAFPGDVRSFSFATKYDFIISNPPFYENDLQSASSSRNLAMHSKDLNLRELLLSISGNLDSGGSFGILLPYQRMEEFEQLADELMFYSNEKLLIQQTPNHEYFRAVLHLSKNQEKFTDESTLVIQKEDGGYTDEFVELMKDYYLRL
jgi:tRNA1Val (adenine37-N6)-methyltransferase